jgi:hypothetical protein
MIARRSLQCSQDRSSDYSSLGPGSGRSPAESSLRVDHLHPDVVADLEFLQLGYHHAYTHSAIPHAAIFFVPSLRSRSAATYPFQDHARMVPVGRALPLDAGVWRTQLWLYVQGFLGIRRAARESTDLRPQKAYEDRSMIAALPQNVPNGCTVDLVQGE